jgi:hypothetical protein
MSKDLSKEEIEKLMSEHLKKYLDLHIMYLEKCDKDFRDVELLKCNVEIPEGGKYLFSFIHFEGPKIKLNIDSESV